MKSMSRNENEFFKLKKDDLIQQTVSLLKSVFNSQIIEINFYEDGLTPAYSSNQKYVVVSLIDDFENIFGELVMKDISADGLERQAIDILDVVAKNFVEQFFLLEEYSTVKQQTKQFKQEIETHRAELEMLYEDLNVAHEELSQAFTATFQLGKSLSRSKTKISGFLEQAPIAFGILRHRQLKIELANNLILQLWGKDKTVIGKSLADGLPELKGQPYLEILDRVYTTGERYVGKEAKAVLEKEGQITDCYFNFIYEPLKNDRGTINSIMIIATDVSDLVRSRNELQQN
ncbi:MAG: hypothetical protein EOO86_01880 [Pedobacter sp.]|nr:MAG: hypothetical protein EOO86_01880 [Pedobacter sp.]